LTSEEKEFLKLGFAYYNKEQNMLNPLSKVDFEEMSSYKLSEIVRTLLNRAESFDTTSEQLQVLSEFEYT